MSILPLLREQQSAFWDKKDLLPSGAALCPVAGNGPKTAEQTMCPSGPNLRPASPWSLGSTPCQLRSGMRFTNPLEIVNGPQGASDKSKARQVDTSPLSPAPAPDQIARVEAGLERGIHTQAANIRGSRGPPKNQEAIFGGCGAGQANMSLNRSLCRDVRRQKTELPWLRLNWQTTVLTNVPEDSAQPPSCRGAGRGRVPQETKPRAPNPASNHGCWSSG